MGEWARANPAGRDALLALAERAVALQPAAEAGIQRCRPGPDQAGGAQDAATVRGAYRSLRDHLDARGDTPPAPAPGPRRPPPPLPPRAPAPRAAAAEGLGPPAGRLVGLRDLLRRTVAIGGRPVSDVTPGV